MTVTDIDRAPPPTENDAPPEFRKPRRPMPTRVPPHDLAAERALLGAMLLRADAIDAALATGIDAADFYAPGHARAYEAVVELHDDGRVADPVTVASYLTTVAAQVPYDGPPTWGAVLVDLQASCGAISNAAAYAAIVVDHAAARRALLTIADQVDTAATMLYGGAHAADVLGSLVVGLQAHTDPRSVSGGMFRAWTPAELLDADTGFSWLVQGMYVKPTYGMTAGEMKTAKTTVSGLGAMQLAAGLDVLGRFKVTKAEPVVIYVGEGGRIPHTRFLTRVAASLGVEWRDLPIFPRYDIAPATSLAFQRTLARDLDTIRPGLVIVDPYYSFHGGTADARNLHDEASVLNAMSAPVVDAGAVLDVVNHYNRGEATGLKRITMAGGGEWVDTWRLLSHRQPPDVDNGTFWLRLEIGSRQWGGSSWDLDLNLGRFDPELGAHDGAISWTIERTSSGAKPGASGVDRLVEMCRTEPSKYTREDLAKLLGGRLVTARQTVDGLVEKGLLVVGLTDRKNARGEDRPAWTYAATSDDVPYADDLGDF